MGSLRYVELTNINEAGAMVWALITPIFNGLLEVSIVGCLERRKRATNITIESILDVGTLGH